MRRHGLRPRRPFGQNFLVDRSVVERIAAAVGPRPGLRIVEIGAGLGTLTRALQAGGSAVVAIERERDMVRALRADFEAGGGVTVMEVDAVTFDYRAAATGSPTAVAGNLPYNLTGPLLGAIVDSIDALVAAVVMVQREVAERMVAAPGSRTYGALSVMVQARCDAEVVLEVPPDAFYPAPEVHSMVVRLVPSRPPRIGGRDWEKVRRIVRAAFAQRRKKLRNALRSLAPQELVEASLTRAGIDPSRRAETLSVEDFARLADELG
ncbi:MAG: ribosomal RNA small subunit methyltransferase A [Deltaproteobacteria bacterium]|nr:ribosomal RNA small subunit methyltransferase A [Deltaproteobacteria bacterium]